MGTFYELETLNSSFNYKKSLSVRDLVMIFK